VLEHIWNAPHGGFCGVRVTYLSHFWQMNLTEIQGFLILWCRISAQNWAHREV
jgi:hypothetical protein